MTASAITGRLSLNAPHLPHVAQFIPALLYGTAWKKDSTADLVYQALEAGFTGVDTANQPKHYQEHLVGDGVRKALREGMVQRDKLYIQTKFTSAKGHDPNNVPFNPKDPIARQVQDSVKSSLQNLRSAGDRCDEVEGSYLDTLVFYSPFSTIADSMEVWKTLEGFVPHKIRNLGISNCKLPMLMEIYKRASIKPAVLQNRFFPIIQYDGHIRRFCGENSIVYQPLWTLTPNPHLVWSTEVGQLASLAGIAPQAALFCLVLGLGNTVVVDGTKLPERMRADVKAVEVIRNFSIERPIEWQRALHQFQKLLGNPDI